MKYKMTFILIFTFFNAQNQSPGQLIEVDNSEIVLDGILNEIVWEDRISYDDFKQIRPIMNSSTQNSTRFKIYHDDEHLYIGVELFTSNPTEIFASTLNRDEFQDSDDNVIIIIDSYNNKSSALGFQTNLLASRRDFELSSGNFNNINDSWNTFWDVATKQTEVGWVAEFRIPWSSLRYEMNPINTMGFKVIRFDKSSNETDIFPLVDETMNNADLDLVNLHEVNFNNLKKSNPLHIKPYFIGNINSYSELNDEETKYIQTNSALSGKNYSSNLTMDRILSNIGLDIKYKINSNTTLDVTLNTDFAQAEADDQIVNLSRFSAFQPEKRQFFLENKDLFSFPLFFGSSLFHSRKIGIEDDTSVPIIGGLRLAGNLSDLSYGLMSIQSHDEQNANIPAFNYTIGRFKNKISSNDSYIGGLIANKESINSYQRTIGADTQWRFSNTSFIKSYIAGNYSSNISNSKNIAYGAQFAHFKNDGYSTNIVYSAEQENFDGNLGFVNQVNNTRIGIWNGYTFKFEKSAFVSSLEIGYWNSQRHSYDSQKYKGEYKNVFISLNLKNGFNFRMNPYTYEVDVLSEEWEFNDKTTITPKKYKMETSSIYFDTGNGNAYKFNLNMKYGDFYDGIVTSINPSFNYIFNKHLTTSLGINYNKITFPKSMTSDKDPYYRNLLNSRIQYTFNAAFSLNTLLQYDDLNKQLNSNIRFRYNPTEGTDLYVVYNQNLNTDQLPNNPKRPTFQNQSLIIKYSYTLIY